MLVLSRRLEQRIRIGESITITVVRIGRDQVRIGIDAPSDVPIVREDEPLRADVHKPAEYEKPSPAGAPVPLGRYDKTASAAGLLLVPAGDDH